MEFCRRDTALTPPPPGTVSPALRRIAIDFEAAVRSHDCLALLRSLTHLALTTRRARPPLGPWPARGSFPCPELASLWETMAQLETAFAHLQAEPLVAAVRGLAQEGSLEVVEWADSVDRRTLFHVGRAGELAALTHRLNPFPAQV